MQYDFVEHSYQIQKLCCTKITFAPSPPVGDDPITLEHTIFVHVHVYVCFTCLLPKTTAQSNERRAFVFDKLSATMEMSFAFIFPIIVRWHQVESSSPKSELLLHRFSMSFQLIPKNIIGYRSASKVAIVSDLLRFLFLISISSHTM